MECKFVIVTKDHYIGELRFGLVDLHKDLKMKNESVYGGGKFKADDKKKTLELYDRSFDFGLPIFDGWEKLKISSDWKGFKITYTYPHGDHPGHFDGEVIDLTNKLEYDEDL